MAKTMQGYAYECLPTIALGGNCVRYVGVDERSSAALFPTTVTECTGRVLFLGADVMCSTSVLSKNYARVHLRFSKIGLASKMELDGFKIEGVHNSTYLWFYSIQGLFHVAFELGNLDFQKDCLMLLKDEWLKRYHEPLLESSGVLKYNRHHKQTVSLMDDPVVIVYEKDSDLDVEQTSANRHVIHVCSPDDKPKNDGGAFNTFKGENMCIPVFETSVQENVVLSENVVEIKPDYILENESRQAISKGECDEDDEIDNYMDDDEEENIVNCTDEIYYQTSEFKNELSLLLKRAKYDHVSSENLKKIILVLDYLCYFEQKNCSCSFDHFESVLFKIMEEFLVIVNKETDNRNEAIFKNTFDLPKDKYVLLYLISDWLGHEYQELEALIADKVDAFKKENIMSIDYLPSSETLIDNLFPTFMKTFVVNWCGFKLKDDRSDNESDASVCCDHCYSKPLSESRNTNFPLVQLMLEFGSNSLVSGIAHVVFSRLQAQNKSESHG